MRGTCHKRKDQAVGQYGGGHGVPPSISMIDRDPEPMLAWGRRRFMHQRRLDEEALVGQSNAPSEVVEPGIGIQRTEVRVDLDEDERPPLLKGLFQPLEGRIDLSRQCEQGRDLERVDRLSLRASHLFVSDGTQRSFGARLN